MAYRIQRTKSFKAWERTKKINTKFKLKLPLAPKSAHLCQKTLFLMIFGLNLMSSCTLRLAKQEIQKTPRGGGS